MTDIQKVAVIGAGTMGHGIAQVFGSAGFDVLLQDIDSDALERAQEEIDASLQKKVEKNKISEGELNKTLSRIDTTTDLNEVTDVELAIEAVLERADVKKDVFRALSDQLPDSAYLASNTSSISITELASVTDRPDQFIGMHFFNPVPVMKLVEVVIGVETTEKTAEVISRTAEDLGKTPVSVNDYPGFVSNRILAPMLNEAFFTLMEGVAGVEEIDEIMQLGMGHPMGPFELADMIGLDVCLEILEVLHEDLGDDKYRPCPLLRKKVEAGHLGKKSGRGFYDYD